MKRIEIWIIIILCAIIALVDFKSCKTNTTTLPYIITKVKLDTIWLTKDTIVYKPILKHKTDTLYLPEFIDTNKVINDFYTIKTYSDTTLYDSSRIIIDDSVSQNRIYGRKINLSIKSKLIRDSIFIKPKEKLNLYLGPTINPINKSIGLQSTLRYNKIMINVAWNQTFIIGVGWKINKN